MQKVFSPAGNLTRVSHVTGADTYHYTTEDDVLGRTWASHIQTQKKRCKKNVKKKQSFNAANFPAIKKSFIFFDSKKIQSVQINFVQKLLVTLF